MSRVSDLASLIGRKKYDGSSMEPGVTYQNLPSLDIPYHRGKSDWRAERICELVNVKDKRVLDLGCSVGTMSEVFRKHGAASVVSVDHDEDSVNLGMAVFPYLNFISADITHELVEVMGYFGVVIWTSQFMWTVKQRGMEYALDLMFRISQNCDTMVFETAGAGDGMAGVEFPASEIMPMLIKNTCFQSVMDCGPWGDEWATRNVFVCERPEMFWDTNEWTMVRRMDRKTIRKFYKTNSLPAASADRAREIMGRELHFLELLKGSPYFPKVIAVDGDNFTMEYSGMRASWISDEDASRILSDLKDKRISHRDVRPENIVWDGKNCILLDFSYAVHPEDVTNYHYDLGGEFKWENGFSDEFSLKKTQAFLMQKSLERGRK